MNTGLPEFLRAIAAEPFVLGRSDCMTWLADWVMRARNIPDPIAQYRGSYSTESEWRRLTGRDLVGFVHHIAESIGAWRTGVPMVGDIGIVRAHRMNAGAIMGQRGWVIRAGFSSGAPGIARASNATTLAAWRM